MDLGIARPQQHILATGSDPPDVGEAENFNVWTPTDQLRQIFDRKSGERVSVFVDIAEMQLLNEHPEWPSSVLEEWEEVRAVTVDACKDGCIKYVTPRTGPPLPADKRGGFNRRFVACQMPHDHVNEFWREYAYFDYLLGSRRTTCARYCKSE